MVSTKYDSRLKQKCTRSTECLTISPSNHSQNLTMHRMRPKSWLQDEREGRYCLRYCKNRAGKENGTAKPKFTNTILDRAHFQRPRNVAVPTRLPRRVK
ncbi:predicted protein [Plenodomus lingam JN3]|uniref:Predicted protein n=1 Tax=Leptosphaeria maculans (strain JN3 / isolate v23.1.3 / race Av1-4-5-6-7-8) TaxID=985895 RepID=E5AE76_LEPMJ|nr:predicted protein [Plenodomus lingam JN3]CBY01515.1 predicted protein [Plenodomus lingam JN3]